MSVISNNQLAGASGQGGSGYEISRSLRFNSGDSSYLSKTPSSAGNRKTWTWSCWVKKHQNGTSQQIFGQYKNTSPHADNRFQVYFNTSDQLQIHTYSVDHLKTNRVFRDPSAWYHIILAVDTTLSTADNRMRLYVNGVEETSFASRSNPSQNQDLGINTDGEFNIGTAPNAKSSYYINCSLADVIFIDGQAKTASDFGEYDGNNVWQPKKYDGSHGTNGFHLDFNDTSSDSALGTDAAGSNDWTVNNLSSAVTSPVPKSSITYAIAPSDFPGTATNDQSGLSFANTWNVGSNLTTSSYVIIDTGAKGHSVDITPLGSNASISYSDNLINWTTSSSTTANSDFTEGRYYWIQSAPSGYGGGLTLTSASTEDGDSMFDSPTNFEASSGNNRGNYCTWNPIDRNSSANYSEAPTNGNLDTNPRGDFTGTLSVTSGKWYWEITITKVTSSGQAYIGVLDTEQIQTGNSRGWSTSQIAAMRDTGSLYGNGSTGSGVSYAQGDVLGFALDADAGKLWIAKNNSWINSGNPAGGSGHAFSSLSYSAYTPIVSDSNTGQIYTLNTGQRTFAHTPPTGFVSICTTNLPDPTIADGSTVFDVLTWSGNDNQRNITGLNFSPDLVWIKQRSGSALHSLQDTVRGATKNLVPNDTQGEGTETAFLNAFLSNGFSIGTSSVVNDGSSTYVGWAWDAGSSTSSNTDGGITSSVRANASAGFSIVGYTGTGSNATVGHGLNAAPGLILLKCRDNSRHWVVYHSGLTDASYYLRLDATNAQSQTGGMWNSTAPSSSVFSIGTAGQTNTNTEDFIAYCFAPVSQYSSFGKYTGNGNVDGPCVFTGFRPAFLLIKNSSLAGSNWIIIDAARDTFNEADNLLKPNLDNAEQITTANEVDILSNGFKLRGTDGDTNGNSNTLVYAAFAEHPFKTSRAR